MMIFLRRTDSIGFAFTLSYSITHLPHFAHLTTEGRHYRNNNTDMMKYQRLSNPPPSETISTIQNLFQTTFGTEEGESVGTLSANLMTQTPSNDLFVFVATTNDEIVGCIIFSRLSFPENRTRAFLLGPVGIHPNHQLKGIGQGLIQFGIETLRQQQQVDLLVTYGDPKYYGKVGFQSVTTEIIPSPWPLSQPLGWQALSLNGDLDVSKLLITGSSLCVKAFDKKEYW
mmetsp:Transcript_25147/g.38161  ORF Transcript_25147/g.38161 Transcript_25147/m.38161 type:complete len:228 (+) Transcript_25147:356-1039(+)